MKWQILILTLFLINTVSAVDCWEIINTTGSYSCNYLDLPNCLTGTNEYFDEYLDCRDFAFSKNIGIQETTNMFEKFIKQSLPNLESNSFVSYFFGFNNLELILIAIFIYLIIISVRNKKW